MAQVERAGALHQSSLDTQNTFFMVNPSNDLASTQEMFGDWFESKDGWQGLVGEEPSEEQFRRALTDHELFIYCGHANGEQYLHSEQVQCQ